MRYSPEHKAAARAKLVEAGGALAKKEGFSNTGLDALAAAAGVTTGAFYSQFRSKAELLHAIVDHELSRTVAALEGKIGADLQRAVAAYLSPDHVAQPEQGCPIPSLGAEIARADDPTRAHFEGLLVRLVSSLEAGTGDRSNAWALLAQAVGGVLLARAVLHPEIREEILNALQVTAVNLISAGRQEG